MVSQQVHGWKLPEHHLIGLLRAERVSIAIVSLHWGAQTVDKRSVIACGSLLTALASIFLLHLRLSISRHRWPFCSSFASRCRQSSSPFETRGRPSGSKRWRLGGPPLRKRMVNGLQSWRTWSGLVPSCAVNITMNPGLFRR